MSEWRALLLLIGLCSSSTVWALRPLDTRTHYTVLNVSPTASLREIRVAYLKLIAEYHPDHNPHEYEAAVAASTQLNASYAFLSDADKKAEYDQTLFERPSDEDPVLARFTFSDALDQTPKYLRFKAAIARRVRASMQISGNGFASASSGGLRRRLAAGQAREFAARLESIQNRMGVFSGRADEARKALVTYDVLEVVALETLEVRSPHRYLAQFKWMMSFVPLAHEGLLLRVAFPADEFTARLASALWLDLKADPHRWSGALDNLSFIMESNSFQRLMLSLDESGVHRRRGVFGRTRARVQSVTRRFCERMLGN